MTAPAPGRELLHATTVALRGRGLLIVGPSGTGKSALALQLVALGCDLVSDDRTWVERRVGALWASPPETIAGRIEARGMGILTLPHLAGARLCLAADLSRSETERLPERHTFRLLGLDLPCFARVEATHFAPSLYLHLKAGGLADAAENE